MLLPRMKSYENLLSNEMILCFLFSSRKMNADIWKFMRQQNISSFEGLQAYYMKRLVKLLDAISPKKKAHLVWQEVFDNRVPLDSNAVVHVWKGDWELELAKVRVRKWHIATNTLVALSICKFCKRIPNEDNFTTRKEMQKNFFFQSI